MLSEHRKGELFILAELSLWSLFPVVSKLGLLTVSPITGAAFSSLFAVVFFAGFIAVRGRWNELLCREAWSPMLASTLIIGVGYYLLFFTGLQYTTAGNAVIVALTEIAAAFLFFGYVVRTERYRNSALFGALLMAAGSAIVMFSSARVSFHKGDLAILAASLIAPIGNFYQQKARARVSGETVLLVRSTISGLILLILALAIEGPPGMAGTVQALPALAVNGILLLGFSKFLWVEGTHRIPVAKAVCLTTLQPLITLPVAFLALGERPEASQLIGLAPLVAGAWLIMTRQFLKMENQNLPPMKSPVINA